MALGRNSGIVLYDGLDEGDQVKGYPRSSLFKGLLLRKYNV